MANEALRSSAHPTGDLLSFIINIFYIELRLIRFPSLITLMAYKIQAVSLIPNHAKYVVVYR